jgi:DNA-directed RNA polymerase subunit F
MALLRALHFKKIESNLIIKGKNMNFKRNKIALVLGAFVFLATPLASASGSGSGSDHDHDKHCEIEDTQLSDTMKYMKSELRAYVKGFKKDDSEKMQKHLNELLKLSTLAADQTPVKIKNMASMDHSKMDMKNMPEMDHSKMDMNDMAGMDHGDINSADHDMSTMPSMAGMSAEQHHQHMMYMQGITELNDLFKQLAKTQDKDEIKMILGQVKEHSKKSHQLYRQDCS